MKWIKYISEKFNPEEYYTKLDDAKFVELWQECKYISQKWITKVDNFWEKDYNKTKLAESNGFSILVIWDSEYKNNKEEIIDKCKKFLKNNIKYG